MSERYHYKRPTVRSAGKLVGFQFLRRIVQLEKLEPANEVIFISERDTGKTVRIIHTRVAGEPNK